jgi:hypothetical protein
MMNIFDIATLDLASTAEAGAPLEIRHPVNHDLLGISIQLQGMDSPTYRAIVRNQIDKQINDGKAELSAKELEERLVERLVSVTLNWTNILYQGEAMDCNPQNVRKLYSEQNWIREQVARFVEDRSHFLPA